MQFEFKWLVCFYERAGAVKYNTITQNALDSIAELKRSAFQNQLRAEHVKKMPNLWKDRLYGWEMNSSQHLPTF